MGNPFETQIEQLLSKVKQIVLTALPQVKREQRQEVLLLLALMQDIGVNLQEFLDQTPEPPYEN